MRAIGVQLSAKGDNFLLQFVDVAGRETLLILEKRQALYATYLLETFFFEMASNPTHSTFACGMI